MKDNETADGLQSTDPGRQFIFWKRLLLFFLPLAAVICLVFTLFYLYTSNVSFGLLKEQERNNVALYRESLRLDIDAVLSDLKYLAGQYELQLLLDTDFAKPQNLESDYLVFSHEKSVYDQIRILDHEGMERLRVNYNSGSPAVVPHYKLQNKKDRYYFSDAIELGAGEIFFSPLDLNVENGQIEQPLKPMIRIGMVLYDNRGEKSGLILLNFLARKILHDFEKLNLRNRGIGMLLNRNGYWLSGEEQFEEWGFMYTDKQDETFKNRFPEEWEMMRSSNSGQVRTANGLFTYELVYPLVDAENYGVLAEDYYWIAVSQVTPELIAEQSRAERQTLILSGIILTFLLLSLSVVRTRSKLEQEEANDAISQKNRELEENQLRLKAANKEALITNTKLEETVVELEEALTAIKTLEGIVPICSYCKEIRNDEGYWIRLENYIQQHSHAEFSHSICETCLDKHFPEIDDDDEDEEESGGEDQLN